jgi:hypothetical protein
MTKKHFNKMAFYLSQVEPASNDDCHLNWSSCCHKMAQMCAESNARFDTERFIEACHFDYWKSHKQPA